MLVSLEISITFDDEITFTRLGVGIQKFVKLISRSFYRIVFNLS